MSSIGWAAGPSIWAARRAGSFARHVLFAASLTLGTGVIQCRAQAMPTAVRALTPASVELYGGYAYFHPFGGTMTSPQYDSIQPGAAGSASYYFSRYLGAQFEGAAFPQGKNDSVGTIEAGPVLRYPYGRMSPFVHVLIGGVRQRGPVSQPGYGWGATGGVGLDYVVPGFENRLAIRVAEADFQYTHVNDGTTALPGVSPAGPGEIKAYRLSAGIVLRFGAVAEQREAPLRYSCIALPTTIFAGDPVTVTGTTVGASPGKRSIYTWATNGGRITATEETVHISTAGLPPGDYSITGHTSQGKHPGEIADCTTGYTVQPPQPPTISCSADPVSVAPGGKVTITSRAISPQNRPLSYAYAASAGEISGTDAVATLDTDDAPPGQIDVACRAIDDLGQSAAATTMVTVVAPVPAVSSVPPRPELCTLDFSRDRRHPVTLDIVAQACLNDVALTLKRQPTARLTITGEHTRDEKPGHAAARTLFAKRYLTGHKGIAPARIELKTGMLGSRTAEMKLVLPGEPVRENDAMERSHGVPVAGPIQGLRRAPLATPDDKVVVTPAVTPAAAPVSVPAAVPAASRPAAPAFEEPDGGGFRRSRESPAPLPLVDAPAKTDAGTRAAEVHRKKRKSRHKAATETKPPVPAAGGAR